jgi:hypothetical protein
MNRHKQQDVAGAEPVRPGAMRGRLSEFDGQKMAVEMMRGARRIVLCGQAAFVRDDLLGDTLRIRLDNAEPGHPVLIFSEREWDGRIVPDFHHGCDFCLVVGK